MQNTPEHCTESSRLRRIGERMAKFIDVHGLNDAQRALLITNARAFTQLMLGEMVIAGWLHGTAYDRWLGKATQSRTV